MQKTLHEAFQARARERKDAVALVFGEKKLTYAELDERSNQLAARLRKLGVGAGGARGALSRPFFGNGGVHSWSA